MKTIRKFLLSVLPLILLLLPAAAYAEEEGKETNGDIVILYTSDVHCGIDQGFGYAGLEQVRDYLIAEGNDVILVDDGDNIQGEAIGVLTQGEKPFELMNLIGYSVAIPGNHEFDYGMDQFLSLTEKAEFSYISCNFNYKGELVFPAYVIRELAGKKVAFVGVTTPETLVSSNPKSFMNEEGEYIYGFFQDETGDAVAEAVQKAVDEARAEGADYVVVMGHMGEEAASAPFTYADVISRTEGIDVFLDGHSHDTDQVEMKNKNGETVLRSACGTKLQCIGWCRISAEGVITAGLYTWNNSVSAPELLGIDNRMAQAVREAQQEQESILSEVVGQSEVTLTINDPYETDMYGNPIRMVRRAETNLGDFCTDAYRARSGADFSFIVGGNIRTGIKPGDITVEDLLGVLPYYNYMTVIEVTGQQILDALEWGARAVPDESGGFLSVSGLTYEIHSYIDSSCTSDENGMFTGVAGERRVKNVLVGGEPIDPEKTYTLAGNDYNMKDAGDGFSMLKDATVLQDGEVLDIDVLRSYINEELGGTVKDGYEDLYGQGRIVIVEGE